MLRIDVDHYNENTSYSIPADNPFLQPLPDGSVPRPEIYAYGVRNIWRCGMDRGDPVTGEIITSTSSVKTAQFHSSRLGAFFIQKVLIVFSLTDKTCCGYSLEVPH